MSREPTAEGLTEAEREALRNEVENYACTHPVGSPVESDGRCSECLAIAAPLYAIVERILHDRLAAMRADRDEVRSRVVDAAEDAYEVGKSENLTPSSTDALRTWVVRAGFSTGRRDAALAALDAFDAALVGRRE